MSAESDKPILIVGSMAFDDLVLPSGEFPDVIGGAATYSAIAASLFARPRIVAVVGDDFPASVISDLETRNVDTSGIEKANGKTFRWAGRYADNLASRETLKTELNVFADFRPKLPPSYRDSPVVLLANIQPELQLEVLDQVRAPKFVAADTMNLWIDIERPALERVIKRVQAMVINDEELRQFAGEHNIKRAAQAILSLGPERLIVTRGEDGARLFDADGIFFVPAFPLEDEIDPTGAGDTFAGALLGQLAQLGTVDGSTTRVRNLTVKDVEQRLAELRNLVHVE
ncbi:MAG TPA: PfkB family carbohydrate kinase [Polyangiaceae bacterium]